MLRLALTSVLCLFALGARAQERTFTVTLPETQWNTVGKIMSKALAPWEDTNPIMQQITSQIGQGLQQDAQARLKGIEAEKKLKQTAAELAAMTKKQNDAVAEIERSEKERNDIITTAGRRQAEFIAEIENLKSQLAKRPAAPAPEQP